MSYIEKLIDNCKRALAPQSVEEFEFNDPAQIKLERRLDGKCNCIYVIEEMHGNSEETFKDFETYKKDSTRKCPKANSHSSVLYVGSSTTGLKNRIKQHVGDGPAGTYALNLKHWFKGKYIISVKIYREPIEVLQIIEDDLADKLSPAFGKRGGNNR